MATDPEMSRRLRRVGRAAEEARERRDDLIFQAAQAGYSLREIANHVGLSNPGVLKIVQRRRVLELELDDAMHEGIDPAAAPIVRARMSRAQREE